VLAIEERATIFQEGLSNVSGGSFSREQGWQGKAILGRRRENDSHRAHLEKMCLIFTHVARHDKSLRLPILCLLAAIHDNPRTMADELCVRIDVMSDNRNNIMVRKMTECNHIVSIMDAGKGRLRAFVINETINRN
jgi:hypothetical protein